MKKKVTKKKIKTKDIHPVMIIIPYLITSIWISSFICLIFIKNTTTKIFTGSISVIGFIFLILGSKNLKNLKISPTGIEIKLYEKQKKG